MSDQLSPEAPAPRSTVGPLELSAIPLIWVLELLGMVGFGKLLGSELTPGMLVATGLWSGLVTTLATTWLVCWRHGRSFADGFRLRPPDGGPVWGKALLGVGVGLVGGVLATLLTLKFSTGDSLMAQLTETPSGLLAVSAMAVLLPVVEELYYRGFIFTILDDGLRKLGSLGLRGLRVEGQRLTASGRLMVLGLRHLSLLAVGVVATWFALVHVAQLAGDWIGVPVVATMGLIWTLMRWRWGCLLPSMLSHLTYNATLVGISLASFFLLGE